MPFFDDSNPFMGGGAAVANPFMPPRLNPTGLQPLSPEEEETVLGRLGQSALGGLGYIGGSLDKAFGGRALRGLLGGKPQELLSLIPFSDKMGITNPDDIVNGRDLLGYSKDDNSWGATLGGLGLDIALDPATYLTFGAKTALGQAATKANALAKAPAAASNVARGGIKNALSQGLDLLKGVPSNFESDLAANMKGLSAASPQAQKLAQAVDVGGEFLPGAASQVANKPLQGLVGVGLPFMEPAAVFGTGTGAQNFANALGGIGDSLRFSAPGRAIAPLFDPRMSAFGPAPTSEAAQRVTRQAADDFAQVVPEVINKNFLAERKIGTEQLGMNNPATVEAANRELRRIMETPAGAPAFPSAIPAFNDPAVQELVGKYGAELPAARAGAAASGRSAPVFTSAHGVPYFPRQVTPEGEALLEESLGSQRGAQKWMSSRNVNDLARNEAFDIPGGTVGQTNALNDLFMDPTAIVTPKSASNLGVGQTLKKAASNIRQKIFGWTAAGEEKTLAQLTRDFKAGNLPETILQNGVATPNPLFEQFQKLSAVQAQSEKLAKYASGGVKKRFDEIEDLLVGPQAGSLADRTAAGNAMFGDIMGAKKPMFANNPIGEMLDYRIKDTKSNLSANAFHDLVSGAAGTTAGPDTVSLLKVLDQGTYGNANMKNRMLQTLQQRGLVPQGATFGSLADIHVPAEVAADAMRFGQIFGMPREMNPMLKAFDSVTNWTKAMQTTALPLTLPTLLRNAGTELYTNFIKGARNPHSSDILGGYLGPLLDTAMLRAGGEINSLGHLPMFKGMNSTQQTAKLNELLWQFGIDVPRDAFERAQLVGKGAHSSPAGAGLLADLGGAKPSMKEIAGQIIPRSMEEAKPWNVRGFGDVAETKFAPARAGQEAMAAVDDYGRRSAFIAYLQQGYAPEVAAARAKMMRMGSEDLAPFEREGMMRLIPFYRWLRTSIPGMAGELAQHPGGVVGQSIRGSNELRQNEGMVPDFVGEGLAIPLGGRGEDGTQRYLSGFGLPFEELNRVANNGPTPVRSTMQRMLGNLNPILKAPLEYATNTQFHSGRELDDLYQRVPGAGVGVNELLGNSPAGPATRMGSIMLDPRKGLSGRLAAFSPVRITDADMNRAALVQERRMLEEALRADPNVQTFQRLFVPPELAGQLSPEEMQLLRLYSTVLERQRLQRQAAAPVPR